MTLHEKIIYYIIKLITSISLTKPPCVMEKFKLAVQGDFTKSHLGELFMQLFNAGFAVGPGRINQSEQPLFAFVGATGDSGKIRPAQDISFLVWKRTNWILPVFEQVSESRDYWIILIAVPAFCNKITWCRDQYLAESPGAYSTFLFQPCTKSKNMLLFVEREKKGADKFEFLVHLIYQDGFYEVQLKYHEDLRETPQQEASDSRYSLN